MTILAVGAAGQFAGLVVPALAERGARVRGLVRKPEQAAEATRRGAAEVAVGDLRDRTSLDRALRDIDAVFYIAPAFLPSEAEVGKGMVAAAIDAGVRRFVFSSVIHPVLGGLVNHAAKAPVEEAVLNSDLEYTFLHPTLYFQIYADPWPKIIETGVLSEPWSIETRFTRVDYRDVAEVAAIALIEDRLRYGTFELCSPGNLNRREVAALLTEILGREITPMKSDPGALGDIPDAMKTMFDHYEHHGLLGNPLTLRAILGREPRTLRAYFEELASARTPVE
ncbi:NmrA family NAD(P)-binding protein [Mesorhizobium sp. WSM3224]|uniref:NmrA family NAD(P)-binding protein n=1 Tax=Mesorhizobium sp. WSM3224 TaxID=1040986 RepID=UPI000416011A|nr:NmrA family NAD(P)-binding protein [Mesorhizobium sp. WSM3224]